MKNELKSLYLVLILGFLLNIFFFIKIRKQGDALETASVEQATIQTQFRDFREGRLQEAEARYHHWGRILNWDGLDVVFQPEEALGPDGEVLPAELRIVWVFTEISCDVCRDKLTDFAREIAGEVGSHAVSTIVHADQRRYATAYARMNQVNFPVYFSADYTFMRRNQLQCGPAVLLVDDQDRILASHCPVSTNPDATALFFAFCKKQLGLADDGLTQKALATSHAGHGH